jgi:putative phosphoesterase
VAPTCRIGVISDTHGRLDAAVPELFRGVTHIVHAGDVGAASIFADLARIAPLTAVRGNVDRDAWAWDLPAQAELEVCGVRLLIGHIKEELLRANSPEAEGFSVVITGHSHKPAISSHHGVLYLNPGSAGPRRFALPRACALVTIAEGVASAEIVTLDEAPRWTAPGEPR